VDDSALVWAQLIDHFTDLDAAVALNYTVWWQSGSALMVCGLELSAARIVANSFYPRLLLSTSTSKSSSSIVCMSSPAGNGGLLSPFALRLPLPMPLCVLP